MADLAAVAQLLARGEIACVPTETSYGLAVDAGNPDAVDALVELKGRTEGMPIAVIAADIAQARSLSSAWLPSAEALASEHWPGPLTLVVAAADGLPTPLVGPLGVGVRVSSHPWCRAIAAALGRPITATSANPSGQPAATSVAIARGYFGERVSLYLDGGESEPGPPSTVVAIEPNGAMTVLRAGAVEVTQR